MSALADQFGAKTPSTLKLPEAIEGDGLLVGWSLETRPRQRPIGFSFGADAGASDLAARPILLEGEGHLITIAPTGAGKGIGCVVPALLRHRGPAIVIDPKGENAAITARRRRELGQQVIVLDPIGITSFPGDCLNPLDLIDPHSATAVDEAHVLIDQLLAFTNDRDKFWQARARQLLVGALFHLLTDMPKSDHNLGRLRQIVNGAAESNGALLVEALEGSRHPEARNTGQLFKISAPETLGGIVAFAQEAIDFLRGPARSFAACVIAGNECFSEAPLRDRAASFGCRQPWSPGRGDSPLLSTFRQKRPDCKRPLPLVGTRYSCECRHIFDSDRTSQ
ncbi:TraG/TraD family protein [Sphingopyxis sp. MC1]|nr:TraG/TraD family protein [Sphingopyxis sp. MC1]